MENCFRFSSSSTFRQPYISLALKTVKRTAKYLKLFWYQVFVKTTDIARFPISFCLKIGERHSKKLLFFGLALYSR